MRRGGDYYIVEKTWGKGEEVTVSAADIVAGKGHNVPALSAFEARDENDAG